MMKQILAIAEQLANGQTRQVSCPHHQEIAIIVDKKGLLVSCRPFVRHVEAGRRDVSSCPLLGPQGGCPFERGDKLSCR